MKKFLNSLFLALIILLTGCNEAKATDYINTVKNMNANEDEKMDAFVNRLLRQSEFYLLNKETFAFEEHDMQRVILSYQVAPDEMFKQIKEANPLPPEMKNIEWKIEGKTKKGKVLAAASDLVLVKIPTEDDGDYVILNPKDIQIYNKENNTKVNIDKVDLAMFYLAIIDKYGYKPKVEEKQWYSGVEYYPSGRTKKFVVAGDDINFEDKPLDFDKLSKEIDFIVTTLNKYKFTKENKGGHFGFLMIGPKFELKSASLSKNLTASEKNKINDLSTALNKAETKLKKAIQANK